MKKWIKVSILTILFSLALPAIVLAAGQKEINENDTDQQLNVFTSILPQKYFVEKIGGSRVKVDVLVGPGKSPANYEPTPQQVTELGEAQCFFTIGVPFEQAFLPTIESSLENIHIVDTSEGIQKRKLTAHSHGEKDVNTNDLPDDPHIWLSPRLAKIQALNIFNGLVAADPDGKEFYETGYNTLIDELEQIDAELAEALAPFKGSTIFVFHPAFGYLGDDYGLTQVAIETGGKEPAPSVLEEIIEHAQKEQVKIIFVQPEFSLSAAESVAEAIGGAVVTLNPLNPDYINNLRYMADELKKAFR